jgi:hypothetical protein
MAECYQEGDGMDNLKAVLITITYELMQERKRVATLQQSMQLAVAQLRAIRNDGSYVTSIDSVLQAIDNRTR